MLHKHDKKPTEEKSHALTPARLSLSLAQGHIRRGEPEKARQLLESERPAWEADGNFSSIARVAEGVGEYAYAAEMHAKSAENYKEKGMHTLAGQAQDQMEKMAALAQGLRA